MRSGYRGEFDSRIMIHKLFTMFPDTINLHEPEPSFRHVLRHVQINPQAALQYSSILDDYNYLYIEMAISWLYSQEQLRNPELYINQSVQLMSCERPLTTC